MYRDQHTVSLELHSLMCCTHTPLGSLFCLGFSNSSIEALDFHLTGTPRHAISQKPPEFIFRGTNCLKHRSIQWTVIQYHPENWLINSFLWLGLFLFLFSPAYSQSLPDTPHWIHGIHLHSPLSYLSCCGLFYHLPFHYLSGHISIFMKTKLKKKLPNSSAFPASSSTVLLSCWAVNEGLLHLPPFILPVVPLHTAAFAFPSTSCSLVLSLPFQPPVILFSNALVVKDLCSTFTHLLACPIFLCAASISHCSGLSWDRVHLPSSWQHAVIWI